MHHSSVLELAQLSLSLSLSLSFLLKTLLSLLLLNEQSNLSAPCKPFKFSIYLVQRIHGERGGRRVRSLETHPQVSPIIFRPLNDNNRGAVQRKRVLFIWTNFL